MEGLTWYDLNEIWVCLHHELKNGDESRKENTQAVLSKVNKLMKELDSQETNQSDYQLKITRLY